MPDIKGMTVVEFVQSKLFFWLQSLAIRVMFERDRNDDNDRIEDGNWRIKGYPPVATSGEIIVIRIVGPIFRN
jgi:hypothetical protein